MAAEPFRWRDRYVGFLLLRQALHRDTDALYSNAALGRLLPGLDRQRRLGLIEQDLRDLGDYLPRLAAETPRSQACAGVARIAN